MNKTADLEVSIKTEQQKAVIAGKTSVPFQTFVRLILQRKVFPLFKEWGSEPVIIESELLTSLASAPGDSQENRAHLVIVTLGVGVIAGVLTLAMIELGLLLLDIPLGLRELSAIIAGIFGLGILVSLLGKLKSINRSQRITETMEKVAATLSK